LFLRNDSVQFRSDVGGWLWTLTFIMVIIMLSELWRCNGGCTMLSNAAMAIGDWCLSAREPRAIVTAFLCGD
jgi:hypothetical protein